MVQVKNRAAEHALRCERPARVLNRYGYIVHADDRRDPGTAARTMDKAGPTFRWHGSGSGFARVEVEAAEGERCTCSEAPQARSGRRKGGDRRIIPSLLGGSRTVLC